MPVICPECDATLDDIDQEEAEVGDELTCSECGALLRVASESPFELEVADDDDLDEEDEDDEDGEEDDDFDEDEDDESVEDDE